MINTTCPPRNSLAMHEGYEARRAARLPEFDLDAFEREGRWGLQLTEFWPDLQTLELIFETFEAKEAQLNDVVTCAKLWAFPFPDGTRLEASNDIQTMRWEGAAYYAYGEQPGWIEPKAPWSKNSPRDVARSLWRRVLGNPEPAENGQKFVTKRLVYRRQKTRDTQDDS